LAEQKRILIFVRQTTKNYKKMAKQLGLSEGTKINSVKDITDFLDYMSEKYNISLEKPFVDVLVKAYTKSPKGKDHIVGFNQDNQWFMDYLSDDEVLGRMRIEEDTEVISNTVRVKPRSGGNNITKPKKKRKK
jgi:hypothetical protein